MQTTVHELRRSLQDARGRTLALVGDLADDQFEVPQLSHVNPFLWELGHVAFFFDIFVLGELGSGEPLIEHAVERFESFTVAHARRWKLKFPDRSGILDYMARVEEQVLRRLEDDSLGAEALYLFQLANLHEDMHGEAFTYMRQALGYGAPRRYTRMGENVEPMAAGSLGGDVEIPATRFVLGSKAEHGFTFDNERGQHAVDLGTFSIARAPVTNAAFLEFVQAGGYGERRLWSDPGWTWRSENKVMGPAYWRRVGKQWITEHYDHVHGFAPHQPVQHVSYWEAEAYCRWASRRLPSEAEWELAATGTRAGHKQLYPWGDDAPGVERAQLDARWIGCADVAAYPEGDSEWGCRQMIGNVWEWTSSSFYPYPGFRIDRPYREYSAPWFGDHKVLRGGSWATRSRLIRGAYRNFFCPARRDIFSGFRTCAL